MLPACLEVAPYPISDDVKGFSVFFLKNKNPLNTKYFYFFLLLQFRFQTLTLPVLMLKFADCVLSKLSLNETANHVEIHISR